MNNKRKNVEVIGEKIKTRYILTFICIYDVYKYICTFINDNDNNGNNNYLYDNNKLSY